uniref:Uncharacterized protein n=1 Tax=Knufia peltigerae TaxID=1002370 RepID=A0AA38XRP4_9EURO|nr:hypothetical protein H2204_012848 [Knufia peltigerae]
MNSNSRPKPAESRDPTRRLHRCEISQPTDALYPEGISIHAEKTRSNRDRPRHAALRRSGPSADQILPEPCCIDALELEREHKPEPARRGVTPDETADFLPGAFKSARAEMKRAEQSNPPLGFNSFGYDSLRRIDHAEPEAGVGRWKIPMQTVNAVGVLGPDRIQGTQNGIEVGTGFDLEKQRNAHYLRKPMRVCLLKNRIFPWMVKSVRLISPSIISRCSSFNVQGSRTLASSTVPGGVRRSSTMQALPSAGTPAGHAVIAIARSSSWYASLSAYSRSGSGRFAGKCTEDCMGGSFGIERTARLIRVFPRPQPSSGGGPG